MGSTLERQITVQGIVVSCFYGLAVSNFPASRLMVLKILVILTKRKNSNKPGGI